MKNSENLKDMFTPEEISRFLKKYPTMALEEQNEYMRNEVPGEKEYLEKREREHKQPNNQQNK